MDTGTTEKRARARAAKLIKAIALSAIMAATVILPLASLAETPRGGLDSLGISATEAAINPGDDTQISDLNLNQQNPENGGNGGSLQDDVGVEDADGEPEAPVEGEPEAPADGGSEAPADNEPEAPADNEPETPVDDEPEAPADDEHETPVDGEPAQADQAESESADANPIDNKPVKAMANGINALEEDVEPGVYTVGAGKDYATPDDAIADTGNRRTDDNAAWVMELHEDVTLTRQISIPADMTLTIRSAEGEHYTIDANKKSRVIYAAGENTSLTLRDITITGGINSGAGVYGYGENFSLTMEAGSTISENTADTAGTTYGGGVSIGGAGSSLTMEAGSTISKNTVGGYGGGVHIYGTNVSLTMEAGSTVSNNTALAHGGGVYFGGTDATFTMRGGVISGNSASFFGGGIRTTGANVAIIMEAGSVISGNSVYSDDIYNQHHGGGGVYFWGAASVSLIMKAGSTISGNTTNCDGGGVSASVSSDSQNSITMEAGSTITNNTAGRDGGGVFLSRRDNVGTSLVLKGGEISNNTAGGNGGGVYANHREVVQTTPEAIYNDYDDDAPPIVMPAGAEVAFFGNKADSGPYLLSNTHRTTPPATFEGAVTSLSIEGINEANGFDVSTDELLSAANNKSVFNNYDIGYTTGIPFTNIYTVGPGGSYDYVTPEDALADTDDIRATDGLAPSDFWVMELHNDFTLGAELSIPAGTNLMISSARGKRYKIDADEQGRVIYAEGKNISLTLADVTITGGYVSGEGSLDHDGFGGGVYITGAGSSLTMQAGSVVSDNTATGYAGVYADSGISFAMKADSTVTNNTATINGGGVYAGTGCTFTMEAGSVVSHNTAANTAGGVYVGNGCTFTMEGGSIISNNKAIGGGGAGVFANGSNASVIMKGGEISNNTAANGGGVFLYGIGAESTLSIPLGSQVAFFGNKASGTPYALSEAHRIAPPATFEGDITSLSVEGINEANGFDVSTPELLAAANNKSAFNNYDIAYTAGTQLDVLTISYLNGSSEKTDEIETLLYRGKAPYPLPDLPPGAPKQGMGWSITEASDGLAVSVSDRVLGTGDVLGPASGLSFNLAETVSSHRVSVKFAPAPYTYAVSYDLADGAATVANPASYTVMSGFPISLHAPERYGYTFTGWTADYANEAIPDIDTPSLGYEVPQSYDGENLTTGNIALAANWQIRSYTVRFLDYDGIELSAQRVSHGAAATPPTGPTRAGYSFTGWSAGFGNITADTDITARYEALTTPPPTPIAPGPTPPTPIAPVAPVAPVAPEPKPEPAPESKPELTPGSTTASTEGSGTETPTAKTPATSATPPSPPAGPSTDPVAETPAADDPATDETTGPNATTAAETGAGPEAGSGNEAESGQGTGNAEAKAAGSPLALLSGNGEIVSQDELRELARKAGVPLVGIGDRAVPLIGIDGYAFWSLADLAIILFAAAIAAWNILAYRRRRGQGGLAAATETGGNARPLPIAILAIAIANAALFLLSQDFAAAPLVLVDLWTIPEAALFIAECMLASIASNRANIMYGDSEEVGNAVEVRNA